MPSSAETSNSLLPGLLARSGPIGRLGMVAKRPEDRFSTAKEIWDELGDWERKAGAPTQSSMDRVEEVKSGERYRVLVADDDEVTQKMLNLQLRRAGFEVRLAADGQEAMDLMDSQINICLFDLNMPRATGMDCLRYVNSHFPETPVIILTASEEIQAIIKPKQAA